MTQNHFYFRFTFYLAISFLFIFSSLTFVSILKSHIPNQWTSKYLTKFFSNPNFVVRNVSVMRHRGSVRERADARRESRLLRPSALHANASQEARQQLGCRHTAEQASRVGRHGFNGDYSIYNRK